MSEQEQRHLPPSKRQKVSERLADNIKQKLFLSSFDCHHPIAIVVSPLRKTQASILAKNLGAAGATVLHFSEHFFLRHAASVIIVTDHVEKASLESRKHVASSICVTYVSTKWASAVLSAQKALPINPFVLQPSLACKNSSPVHEPPLHSKLTFEQSDTIATPVWCTSVVTSAADISTKRNFLKRLPRLSCERATFAECIFASPNSKLSCILEKIAQKRILDGLPETGQDAEMRARAYCRASAALKCVPFKLLTAEDAETLDTFGPRVLATVREYLHNGKVQEVCSMCEEGRLKALDEFSNLYGVGVKSAKHFYDVLGLTSMDALRQRVRQHSSEFNESLKKYLSFDKELARVTRPTVDRFFSEVTNVLNQDRNSLDVRMVLCGGFRRGTDSGHDIDLVYCRGWEKRDDTASIMAEVVKRLEAMKLIRCVLFERSGKSGWEESRYSVKSGRGRSHGGDYSYAHDITHAVGELDGKLFRVDIVGVRDRREMGFATIAWSGSTGFQRDLRLVAERKEWTFNEHGLFLRDNGERVNMGIESPSEMDIFQALGLVYRASYERSA